MPAFQQQHAVFPAKANKIDDLVTTKFFAIGNSNPLLRSHAILILYAMPNGVTEMSRDIPNFVQTSTNLASVKTYDDYFFITTSQRSSVASALGDVVNRVAAVLKLAGAEVEHTDGYPGWSPNPKSNILQVSKKSYENLFNEEPKVLAAHAGLACGLIGETYPGMDMISYGSELKGVHSPDEKIHIKSVEKFRKWTLDILKNIPLVNQRYPAAK